MGNSTPHGSSTRWSSCSLYPTSPSPSSPRSRRSSTTPPINASWSCSSPPSSPPAAAPSPTSSAPPPIWPPDTPPAITASSPNAAGPPCNWPILAGFILDRWVPDGPDLPGRRRYRRRAPRPRSSARAAIATRCARRIPTPPIAGGTNGSSWPSWSSSPSPVGPGVPVLAALYRNPEKEKAAAVKPRRRKPKDRTKAKAKERAGRRAAAAARAKAEAKEAAKAKKVGAPPPRRHKTPSELMRQLLAVLIHWFPDRQFVFAGDGGYGTHALSRFAQRHRRHLTLVSLFYANAALHDPRRWSWARSPAIDPARRERSGPPPRRWWPRPSDANVWRCRGTAAGAARSRWSAARPLAQVGRGPGRGALGVRPRPDRDPPRLVPLQHRPGVGGRPGDRDVHRSLEHRDDLPGDAGVPRVGDDAGGTRATVLRAARACSGCTRWWH